MAAKKSTSKADPDAVEYDGRHPNAAATDASRLEARSAERRRIGKAQRLAEGEKERQKARAEKAQIHEDSLKVLADK